MESYSIAQVEALTGIHAHTLRIWEKRYGFIVPSRTETKIRFYTADQLKALLNTSVLLKDGFKISKISKMDIEQLDETSYNIQSLESSHHSEIQALKLCMLDLDEEKFNHIFRNTSTKYGLQTTISEVIYPFLNQVGILWGTNQTMPAQEHFISNLLKRKLFSAIEHLPTPTNNSKKIILFLPPNERHELGLLLAYYILKKHDWKVYYLGSDVPLNDLKKVQGITKTNLLLTFLISTASPVEISELKQNIDGEILISGNPELITQKADDTIQILNSPQDLIEYLESR